MSNVSNKTSAVIAANRFGLGAKPDDLYQAEKDPQKWLTAQLTPVRFTQELPTSDQLFQQLSDYQTIKKQNKKTTSVQRKAKRTIKNAGILFKQPTDNWQPMPLHKVSIAITV
ncbi:DUF1800 family protein [Thalassotalea sp. ND16A]|uniref:DUF1800 family protein n=1 Tax=Thalassotalea sp. ND16A TaxID=1535422 RepID=UPI00051A0FC9|nr:DUF1800 family protein [Thalassotalea sp. ND16A]KGJ89236.1 hypothetical protein ND16A_2129 [Thalassotalea sp. ND16A]